MQNIDKVPVYDQYKSDSILYAMEVNRRRSIPDYRDGLKQVHRRIIDVMYSVEKCINHTVKSSAIVGSVMKKSHPHGDTAIYQSMKPMANWFECNIPFIISQGGFGSFQGDGMSASRYTEAMLSPFALDCLIGELKESKKVVDWAKTFDQRSMEPLYFPVTIPMLLIQGAFGIGYGMKVELPKHSINDVIDETIKVIDNPNHKVRLIPDQSMKTLLEKSDFKSISDKGAGKFSVKGIIEIDDYKGYPRLRIMSTPDLVFLNTVTEKIEELIKSKQLLGIKDMYDESQENQMMYTILLAKGVDPYYIRSIIYKKTEMRKTFNVNFEALDGPFPVRMNYTEYIQSFILLRRTIKYRLYCNKLKVSNTKFHEKDAYIKALQSGKIDDIINMIRKQNTVNDEELIQYLKNELDITDLQARYIISANIKTLSIGYLNKYIEEAEQYKNEIELYNRIIHDNDYILNEIKEELKYYKKKYNKPRNTIIVEEDDEMIPKGEFNIIITDDNFIKKSPVSSPVNIKGRTIKQVIHVENQHNILIFDQIGKVYKLPIHKIPLHDKNNPGIDIRLLIKNLNSNIVKVLYEPILKTLSEDELKYYLVMVTAKGNIKKMDLLDFLTVVPSGLIAFKVDQDDIVKDVNIIYEKFDVIVYSDDKATRFNMEEIPYQKRNNKGQKSMQTDKYIDGMSIIIPNSTDILVITNKGVINRFNIVGLPYIGRNKLGVDVINLNKGDSIKSIHTTTGHESILTVLTADKSYDIKINDIPIGSSISSGTKMIPVPQGDVILKTFIR